MLLVFVLVACSFLSVASAGAQENPAPPTEAGGGQEPSLPPVIVRPESRPATEAGGTGDPGPGTPPGEGDSNSSGPPADPYPGLSTQAFGRGDGKGLDSIVRGEKALFHVPAFGTIVDRQSISEKQADDMFRALQDEVGVLMQRTAAGHSSPFIRGLTGQQILMLIDGVRVNTSIVRSGPNQYFNLIDPGQIERIEIIRGPQSVLWGSDAIGGAINVVTRSAAQDRGTYGGGGFTEYFSTADRASYSRANVEGWVGNTGVFGGGSYLNVNDLCRGGDRGVQPYTHYDQYAGDIKFNYLLDRDSLLTVALQHFEQSDVPRSDRFAPFVDGPPAGTPRPTWYDPQQRDLAYLRWQGVAGNGLFDAYSATFSYSRNREGSREITDGKIAEDPDLFGEFSVNTFGFTLALSRDLDWAGRLTYGADYYYDDVDAWRYQLKPDSTHERMARNPQFPDDSRYQRTGVYLNWDVDLTEQWAATAGVRYEDDEAAGTINQVVHSDTDPETPFNRSYSDWIASVGLVHKTTDWLHLFGNVSEGYRAPNLDDLTVDRAYLQGQQRVIPSLNVKPEHAMTYEVGFKVDAPRLRLQVSEYWTDIKDNIVQQAVDAHGNPVGNKIDPRYGTVVPGSTSFIRSNADAYVNGTELAGEYLVRDGWWIYGNFWYTFNWNESKEEYLGRLPPTQGILGVRWRDSERRSWFDVYTWLVARQDKYSPINNTDARYPLGGNPAFATLNLRTGTTIGCHRQHRVSLTLENITNTFYHVVGSGVDGPGFNAIFGYEWTH